MHHIASFVGNGSNSIAFTNIPQNYAHLQIRFTGRSLNLGTTDFTYMRFNNDMTSGNYASRWLAGEGTTAFTATQTGTNYLFGTIFPGGTATANIHGSLIIDIYDYANAAKNKTVKMIGGFDANGSGAIRFVSGVWLSTSAITTLVCSNANAFDAAGTRGDLYGITDNPIATGA